MQDTGKMPYMISLQKKQQWKKCIPIL